MTNLDPSTIAYYWEHQGGNPNTTLYAVSVAWAESGGRTDAVSPSDDHGLWQINRVHFGELGLTDTSVLDPNVNAWAAIRISGNGANWGPWCTAVRNISDCGRIVISAPQSGSAAANQEAFVNDYFVTHGIRAAGAPPPGWTPNPTGIEPAWSQLQRFLGDDAKTRYRQMDSIFNAIRRVRL